MAKNTIDLDINVEIDWEHPDMIKLVEAMESKIAKLKALMLLTDPVVSNVQTGSTQVTQWGEFCKEFPDEA